MAKFVDLYLYKNNVGIKRGTKWFWLLPLTHFKLENYIFSAIGQNL